MIKKLRYLAVAILAAGLVGCASEPPREVSSVSSSKTKALNEPKISKASTDGLNITYIEASMGFDGGCNPYKSFSSELNQCSELPENVAKMAIDHCEKYDKKAMFHGNGTSLLQMTVSKFTCDKKD
ncbi:MAG: hypothetical protein ACKVKL_11925 [Pseudomonadales bacterium]|jgi:hypothetical protein|tara:strand:+ start:1594 stop:1971 length:378 start_codon:yes stop_codon:yes gene_type:complete